MKQLLIYHNTRVHNIHSFVAILALTLLLDGMARRGSSIYRLRRIIKWWHVSLLLKNHWILQDFLIYLLLILEYFMKIYSYYFEKNTLEGCLALFVQYPLPSHPPAPSKSQFAALFVQYSCATRRCGSNPRPLLALLYYYTTHSLMYILYYLSPHIILNRV